MTMGRRVLAYLGLAEEDDRIYDDEVYVEEEAPEAPDDHNVRRLGARGGVDAPPRPAPVRAVPNATVHVTAPGTFNDVEEIGARFRAATPVIMDLAGANETVAKRVLDFASGLIYGLEGRIERVGDRVFLLTPMGVEVSTEERRRLSERGFFNQA